MPVHVTPFSDNFCGNFIQRKTEHSPCCGIVQTVVVNCLERLEGAQSTIVLCPLRVFESEGVKGQKEKARTDPLHQLACTWQYFFFSFEGNTDFGSLPNIAYTESPVLCISVLPPFSTGEQADEFKLADNQTTKKKKKIRIEVVWRKVTWRKVQHLKNARPCVSYVQVTVIPAKLTP